MTPTDHPSTTESRIAARALQGLEHRAVTETAMNGLNDEPTSPRDNPPVDERRVARAHEDFHRVLGN